MPLLNPVQTRADPFSGVGEFAVSHLVCILHIFFIVLFPPLSHVPGLQTYNSKQPFSMVNGVAVQIYRQASKLTTSPGSLRLHIEITCDYITLQIYMRPAKRRGWKSARLAPRAIRMALRIFISGI